MLKLFGLIVSILLITESAISQSTATSPNSLRARRERRLKEDALQRALDEAIRRNSRLPIEFRGSRTFSNEGLLKAMYFLDEGYMTDTGNFSRPKLEYDLMNVREFLGARGFLQAKVDEFTVEETIQGTKIIVFIEEGTRYRIGALKVKGAKVFTPDQILSVSGLRTGEIANAVVIRKVIYESGSGSLSRIYANQGYPLASMELEPSFQTSSRNAQEGIVDFTIHIVEGGQYSIGEVMFVGSPRNAFRMLGEQLLFQQGNVYCQDLIDESIEQMNRLGIVAEIRQRDIISRKNDRTKTIDLDIQVADKEIEKGNNPLNK